MGRLDSSVVVAAGAALGVTVATVHGMTVSHDSYIYASAARSISAGRGFIVDGEPLVGWPPGYPAILGIGARAVDVFTAARVLNVVLFAVTVWLAGAVVGRLGGGGQRVYAVALAATSPALFLSSTSLLSEMTFTALIAAVAALVVGDPVGWPAVAVAGSLVGAACIVRWAGLGVLLGAALAMLVDQRRWPQRLGRAAVVAVLGLAPFLLVAAHNRATGGTTWGRRPASEDGAIEVLLQFLRAWGASMTRHIPPTHVAIGAAAVAGLAILVWRSVTADDQHRRLVLILAGYLGFIVASRIRTGYDELNPRFMAPALPLVAALWVGAPVWSVRRARAVGAVVLVGAVVCFRAIVAGVVDGPQERPDLFASAMPLPAPSTTPWRTSGPHRAPLEADDDGPGGTFRIAAAPAPTTALPP